MRAQIAIEYISIMMLAIMLMVGYLSVAHFVASKTIQDNQAVQVDAIAVEIQSELITATQVRPGYRREFFIPDEVSGFVVYVNGSNGTVTVRIEDAVSTIRTPPFSGRPQVGTNVLERTQTGVVFS